MVLIPFPLDECYVTALAVSCPTCGAPPGEDCNAPRKVERWRRVGARPQNAVMKLHVTRQDRGR